MLGHQHTPCLWGHDMVARSTSETEIIESHRFSFLVYGRWLAALRRFGAHQRYADAWCYLDTWARSVSLRSTHSYGLWLLCYLPDGLSRNFCVQLPREKFSAFAVGQITFTNSSVSPHKRGGSRSSRTRGGMRWTQVALLTRALCLRTAKSCGPDAPTLASSS